FDYSILSLHDALPILKRFVIRRLFGIGFFKTYRAVFGWLIATTFAFAILSLMLNRIQERFAPLTMGRTDHYLQMIILCLAVIEVDRKSTRLNSSHVKS